MANEQCALRTGRDQPLADFSIFLSAQGLEHELGQDPGGWSVWVAAARDVPRVRRLYAAYASERGLPPLADDRTPTGSDWSRHLRQIPLTVMLLLSTLAVTWWTGFGADPGDVRLLTIVDFELVESRIRYPDLRWLAQSGEWWRLLSPILLHFNVSHFIFNGLWIWLLGGHLERAAGPWRLLALVVVLGVVSNLAQFQASGPLFGGLSGVAFGLLAYCLVMQGHRRYAGFQLSPLLWAFAIAYIAIGFTPFTATAGLGEMANAAHVAGLVAGLALGVAHRLLLHALE